MIVCRIIRNEFYAVGDWMLQVATFGNKLVTITYLLPFMYGTETVHC